MSEPSPNPSIDVKAITAVPTREHADALVGRVIQIAFEGEAGHAGKAYGEFFKFGRVVRVETAAGTSGSGGFSIVVRLENTPGHEETTIAPDQVFGVVIAGEDLAGC